MKIKSILSLLMAVLMLVGTVPFVHTGAVYNETVIESYTETVENSYRDSAFAEGSSVGRISFFSRTEYDTCYGNQLSGVAGELYDSMVKHYVTEDEAGEYTYGLKSPYVFPAEISGGSIVMNDELEEAMLELQYAAQAALDAFLYDYPQVFWLRIIESSYSISATGNSADGYTGIIDEITIRPKEIYDGAVSDRAEYNSAVTSALEQITVTESRYESLKNIHDYVCENAWYNLIDAQTVHSSAPVFIGDGGVVCEGYAKTFKVICDRLGIPCVLVSGDAGGAHMWNYVQMDDSKWYLVDATWDDQESRIYDTYFLADKNAIGFDGVTISEERTEHTDFSGTGIFSFTYPVLSSDAYTVHVHEWDSDYTVNIEPTCSEKGSKSIHCKGCDERKNVTEIPATNNHSFSNFICSHCGEYDEKNLLSYGACGEGVYYTLDKDGDMRIYGEGEMAEYAYGYAPWYAYKDSIDSLTVDSGVTAVSDLAFLRSYRLAFVSFCEGLETIGDSAFSDCDKLTQVVIPDSTSYVGVGAFNDCDNLISVTIGKSVSEIGNSAFRDCDNLENIIVDKNNKNYSNDGSGVLFNKDKTELVQYPTGRSDISYDIPDSVVTVGYMAFKDCIALENVTIGKNVETLSDYAFYSCNGLADIIIPENITRIGHSVFYKCDNLKTVHYLGSVSDWNELSKGSNDELKGDILHYCSEKEKDATCTADGNEYGWFCGSCNKYIIGGDVVTSSGHAFSDSYTVDKVPTCTENGSESQHCTIEGCDAQRNIRSVPALNHKDKTEHPKQESTCTDIGFTAGVYCPDCEMWLEGNKIIPTKQHFDDNSDEICDFCGCPRKVVDYGECGIDDDVINWILYSDGELVISGEGAIDIYLDDYCDSWNRCADKVKKITIGYGMTYMGSASFHNCINLTSITIPDSVKVITEYSFDDCDNLTDVYFVGTQEQWDAIEIYDQGNGNDNLLNAALHFVEKCEHSDTTNYLQQNAGCNKVGFTAGEYCNGCGMWISGHEVIPTISHNYESVTTPATLTKAGKTEYVCSCGDTYTETIAKISSVTLSKTDYIYDGKNKTPKVTVKDTDGRTLTKNTDYKLSVASKRSGIGRYTVKVTFIGDYSGTKNVYFYIKTGKPATVKSASQTTSSVKLSWSAVPGASGYTVYRYSPSKSAYVKAGTTEGTSFTVKSLYSATEYTFKVVAYGKTTAGKVYDSESYALLKSGTMPGKPSSVKSASQTTSSVKLSWSAVTRATGYNVYRYSPSKKAYVKAGSTTGTSLAVKSLYDGTKYTFRVVPYFKTSDGTIIESSSYALLKTATKTNTPTLSKVASSSKGKATLTWSAVDGETGYTVYYSTKKDSGFKKYANFKADSKSGTATGLTSGKTYYFKVRTYITTDSGYVYSAWSAVKSVKVK